MGKALKEIEKDMESLSPEDQEILVQRFFDRQLKMEPALKDAWIREADKRLDEMLNGEVEGIPAEEVFSEMQNILDEED